jgi:hypothetical protein
MPRGTVGNPGGDGGSEPQAGQALTNGYSKPTLTIRKGRGIEGSFDEEKGLDTSCCAYYGTQGHLRRLTRLPVRSEGTGSHRDVGISDVIRAR